MSLIFLPGYFPFNILMFRAAVSHTHSQDGDPIPNHYDPPDTRDTRPQ